MEKRTNNDLRKRLAGIPDFPSNGVGVKWELVVIGTNSDYQRAECPSSVVGSRPKWHMPREICDRAGGVSRWVGASVKALDLSAIHLHTSAPLRVKWWSVCVCLSDKNRLQPQVPSTKKTPLARWRKKCPDHVVVHLVVHLMLRLLYGKFSIDERLSNGGVNGLVNRPKTPYAA